MVEMTLEKAHKINNMIFKELSRNSLEELCEDYGIALEDFYLFMSNAVIMTKFLEMIANPDTKWGE